jgi:hypothetical protein
MKPAQSVGQREALGQNFFSIRRGQCRHCVEATDCFVYRIGVVTDIVSDVEGGFEKPVGSVPELPLRARPEDRVVGSSPQIRPAEKMGGLCPRAVRRCALRSRFGDGCRGMRVGWMDRAATEEQRQDEHHGKKASHIAIRRRATAARAHEWRRCRGEPAAVWLPRRDRRRASGLPTETRHPDPPSNAVSSELREAEVTVVTARAKASGLSTHLLSTCPTGPLFQTEEGRTGQEELGLSRDEARPGTTFGPRGMGHRRRHGGNARPRCRPGDAASRWR